MHLFVIYRIIYIFEAIWYGNMLDFQFLKLQNKEVLAGTPFNAYRMLIFILSTTYEQKLALVQQLIRSSAPYRQLRGMPAEQYF